MPRNERGLTTFFCRTKSERGFDRDGAIGQSARPGLERRDKRGMQAPAPDGTDKASQKVCDIFRIDRYGGDGLRETHDRIGRGPGTGSRKRV